MGIVKLMARIVETYIRLTFLKYK